MSVLCSVFVAWGCLFCCCVRVVFVFVCVLFFLRVCRLLFFA